MFLLLGILHVWHTPQRPDDGKRLAPADPGVADSMARSRLLLTRGTDVWRAWVGFNLSHSLGLFLLALTVVLAGRTAGSFEYNAEVFIPLAIVVSLAYLGLSLHYWFRAPSILVGVATFLFSLAWVLRAL